MKQYAGRGACFQVQSVLAKLSLCRTRALGGKTYQCNDCGEVTEVHHSCSDRHCPQCSGCKRYDFAKRAEQLILPGVTYYQVVFTLPSELSEMALSNREAMADLLFESAAASLHKTIRTQQDYEPASMMILHTWNQRLEPHWHVHALVPGGGPGLSKEGLSKEGLSKESLSKEGLSKEGLSNDEWKSAQSPPGAPNSDDYYLVDAISLREAFRKAAISHLRRLYKAGELKLGGKFAYLQDEDAWKTFCDSLAAVDWVSFIQPPPTKSCTAEQVVRYLARYLVGGPINDSRIIAADEENVTFMAREGKRVGGEREQVPVTLETMEFTRRWCLHIQPDQLTKTRYFGGWCSRKRTAYQARCRALLSPAATATLQSKQADEPTEPAASPSEPGPEAFIMKCPCCESESLRLVGSTAKPSWSIVLTHFDKRCPSWYAEAERAAFCEHLEREYGIGYEDWCLEMRIESPMSEPREGNASPPTQPFHQMYLPGLSPEPDFAIQSY